MQKNQAKNLVTLGNIAVTEADIAASRIPKAGAAEPLLRASEVVASGFHAPGTKKKPGYALSGLMTAIGISVGLYIGNHARDFIDKYIKHNPHSHDAWQRFIGVVYRAIPPLGAIISASAFINKFYNERENETLANPKNVFGMVEKAYNLHGQSVTKVVSGTNTLGASSGVRQLGLSGWFNSLMFGLRQYVTVAVPGLNKLISGVHDNEAAGPVRIFSSMIEYCQQNENPNFEKIEYFTNAILTRISGDNVSKEIIDDRSRKFALEIFSTVRSFTGADGVINRDALGKFMKTEYTEAKVNEIIFGAYKPEIESTLKPGDKGYNHRSVFGGLGYKAGEIRLEPAGVVGAFAKRLVTEPDIKQGLQKIRVRVEEMAKAVVNLANEAMSVNTISLSTAT